MAGNGRKGEAKRVDFYAVERRQFGFAWEIMKVKLGDVCERGASNIAQKDILDMMGEYPIYGAAGHIGNVNFYHQEKPYVAVVKDGAGIGRTMLLPARTSVIGTLQYLLPKEKILPEYLYYVVRHMHLEKYFTGATIPHIYFKNYQDKEFFLAKMSEQRKIIAVLKKIEKAIGSRMQELELLDTFIKARFVEMFGDPIMNTMDWPVCELSEHIQFLTSGSRGWAKYFTDEGEYFITIKNVKNCRLMLDEVQYIIPPDNAEAKRTRVQEGDLLISITADLGRTAVVTKGVADYGGYINQHLTRIRLNKTVVCPIYAAYYMESEAGKKQFQSKNQSAVKAGLNFNAINTLKLMLPPLELQNQFAAFVTQTDKSKVAIQKSLDETQLLFDSLMQEYFS